MMLLPEYGKYQTNTIYISRIPGQLALIIINTTLVTKRIYSPLRMHKAAIKQIQDVFYAPPGIVMVLL